MLFRWAVAASLAFSLSLPVAAELMAPKTRTPQFPLKTQRMLLNDEEIAVAKENMAQYPTAQGIADTIITRADAWVAWEDDALRAIIPTADVPRAFNVGTAGCPKCGQEIYAKGGTYPWIIDPKIPFKVKCPVDGSVYPSNDYNGYYNSELNDKTLLTGDYADDGWGWVGPNGERYWFVAYANHWIWRNHVIPAVQYLARAYILTGDPTYAHKAIVMLDRIAEVYPNMDYHGQSRYGQLQAANGARYEGKIINHIWATLVLTMLAESYDYVWDAIDDSAVPGKTGEAVRANIEANLLEDGIDAYFSGKVDGNFGMHQKALVYAGLARQYGKQDEWFGGLLDDAGSSDRSTGLNYALYNLVYRDGPPYETSPGYNFSWVENITVVADALRRADYDVFALSKMRRLYEGVLDVINADKFTPALGDSSSVDGGLIGADSFVFQSAWRALGDERYRDFLQSFNATGEAGIRRFESLFLPVVDGHTETKSPVTSRLMDGYGMAILNNPSNTVSLALYYGYKGGHGHYDRLSFELFANDTVMMPDSGYPDFMNAYVPGIFTWSKNTISHNTVTVDASRQTHNYPGTTNLFVDGGFARALDIDAARTYPQTSEYRRRMLLIDMDDTHAYAVDHFTVVGGSQHDYSIHGAPGNFEALDGNWSDPAAGTLAGPEVPLGYIYDDLPLAAEGFTGSYANYRGSGFQHLQNVKRLVEGKADGQWKHQKYENAELKIGLLEGPQEFIHAQAQISPVKQKTLLDFFIARNTGENLRSEFTSVIEPSQGNPWTQSQQLRTLATGVGRAIEVTWNDPMGTAHRDVIFINQGDTAMGLSEEAIETDALLAIFRFRDGALIHQWSVGGTYALAGEERRTLLPTITGTVTRVDPVAGQIYVTCEKADSVLSALPGKIAHFVNPQRRTAHPIQSVEATPEGFVMTCKDDLRVGRVRIAGVTETGLTTATGLSFAPVYDGTHACDEAFSTFVPLTRVNGDTLEYVSPHPDAGPFAIGQDAWIVNVGPGDQIEIPQVSTW
mgnify:CR=1 FL=1